LFHAKWIEKFRKKKCSAAGKKRDKSGAKDTAAEKAKKAEMLDIQSTLDNSEAEWCRGERSEVAEVKLVGCKQGSISPSLEITKRER
jgi:hypothetical protein